MNRVYRSIFFMIAFLLISILMIKQYTTDYSINRLIFLLTSGILNMVSSAIIIFFLMYKVYTTISKEELKANMYFTIIPLLALPLLMMINIITDNPFATQESFHYPIIFRFITVLVIIYNLDIFIKNKQDYKLKISVVSLTVIVSSLVFMLDITMVDFVITFYYLVCATYLFYLLIINTKQDKELYLFWIQNFVYIIIGLSLINDIMIIIIDIKSIEMLFIGISASIVISIIIILVVKIKSCIDLGDSKSTIERKLNEFAAEKKKNDLFLTKFKEDLSNKYMTKHNYFENLELILEVSDMSIIIVNSNFEVELSHGLILEASKYGDMRGVHISKALFETSSDEGLYFKSVLEKVFAATDEIREEIYLSLLDQNVIVNNIMFMFTYNILVKKNQEKILIIKAKRATDSSQHEMLIAQEKEISDMITSIVKNSDLFFNDLSSYLDFIKKIATMIDDKLDVSENIFKILRKIHTYKGVFDQYRMSTFLRGLNDIENELLNLIQNIDSINNEQFSKILLGYDLEGLLNIDLYIIKQRLGESFLNNKNKLSVDITAFNRIIGQLQKRLVKIEDRYLIKELEQLKEIDIKELLLGFKPYVDRIVEDNGKLAKFVVEGDSIFINRYHYVNIFEGLIHIFKNCVVHGIEYPDERRKFRKSECAEILCDVLLKDDKILIIISDDGRGIDVKEIKNQLFILGRYTMDELESLDDSEVCNMIVEDGLTSKSTPNAFAGRGVGMGSLKEIIEEINGTINIVSRENHGVEYRIELPLLDIESNTYNDDTCIMSNVCIQFEKILTKTNSIDKLSSSWKLSKEIITYDQILDCTILVTIIGFSEVSIAISADEKFMQHLVNLYGMHLKKNKFNLKVLNDALSCFSIDVATKTAEEMKNIRETIKIIPPVILTKSVIKEKITGRSISTSKLEIGEGTVLIAIITVT